MAKKKRGRPRKKKADSLPKLDPQAKRELFAIVILLLAIVSLLAFFNLAGPAGIFLDSSFSALFGFSKYLVPFALTAIARFIAYPEKYEMRGAASLGIFLLLTSWGGLLNLINFPNTEDMLIIENVSAAGGYTGLLLGYPAVKMVGVWGGGIILVAVFAVSLLLTFNISFVTVGEKIAELTEGFRGKLRRGEEEYEEDEDGEGEYEEDEEYEEDDEEDVAFESREIEEMDEEEAQASAMTAEVKKKRRQHIDVPLDLLEHKVGKPTSGDINGRINIIDRTLENFGIPVDMGEVSVGPTVTQFTLRPADGVKLSKILSLQNDLALALAAHPIRIEAPIPGKSMVGIEVPNQTVAIVTLRELLDAKEFKQRKSNLSICLGKDVAGAPWVVDLAKMPHLLVAGSTGSGKTVCLNTIIISLLYQNSPDDLRLLLIDPKRVELPTYNGIPHLLTPAVTEVPKIINSLKWAIGEMDRRYDVLSKARQRDIEAYNEKNKDDKLPYIVVVIDELADLMVNAASEVETCIIRLAQMARAVGIHLIVATQRPSVDVITGLIKANITSRIAFSVASSTDSRTILDTPGAERLVGRGDMLFISSELSKPKRIQCCYVSDMDIKKVADFFTSNLEEPHEYIEGITEKTSSVGGNDFGYEDDVDELYGEARQIVIEAGKASASYLQRRLKIGYARAARLLDTLEERGIIGPGDGAKPREILVNAVSDVDGMHYEEDEGEDEEEDDEEEYDE